MVKRYHHHHQLIIAEAQNHHPTERGESPSEKRGGDRGGSGPGTLGCHRWGRRCWEDGGRMAIFLEFWGMDFLQMRFLFRC